MKIKWVEFAPHVELNDKRQPHWVKMGGAFSSS
jgi:hypothetical protein